MRFLSDNRAQSIQVGAVLLFGVLIILLSTWQAFAIPNQNEGIEFNHNGDVQQQMTELRSTTNSMPNTLTTRSVTLDLGLRYPTRTLFRNPPPVSGTVETVGTDDESFNITLTNATAVETNVADFWNGDDQSYETGAIQYRPSYNLYDNAPDTVYEHSVLYNRFEREGETLPRTGQALIRDDRISFVAIDGDLEENRVDSTSVDIEPLSTDTRQVEVEGESGPVTIEVVTGLAEQRWGNILDEERVENGGNVESISTSPLPDTDRKLLEITLQEGEDYTLQMAKVGFGTGAEETNEAYITDIASPSRVPVNSEDEVTVEVRDRFNNPVRGVEVTAAAAEGVITNTDGTQNTDRDGQATFAYESPDSAAEDETVQVSFADQSDSENDVTNRDTFDASVRENLRSDFSITSEGSESERVYSTAWNVGEMSERGGASVATSDASGVDLVIDPGTNIEGVVEVKGAETGDVIEGVEVDVSTTNRGMLAPAKSSPNGGHGDTSAIFNDLSGDGTESNPYEITTDQELQAMSVDSEAHYELSRSIDASGTDDWNGESGFKPVELDTGSFDGNGYSIDGLYIDRNSEEIGLFGLVTESTVRDVGLVDADITGNSLTGALVGKSEASTLENTFSTGSVEAENKAGGLVGENEGGELVESFSTATVTGTKGKIGGIIGEQKGSTQTVDSYARGDVDGTDANEVGGLIGKDAGRTDRSYATGSVTGDTDVGGLIGKDGSDVTDSYWDEQSTGQDSSAGGTGLQTDEMQGEAAEDNMNGFDFDAVWRTVVDPGDYPELSALDGDGSAAIDKILPSGITDRSGEYSFKFASGDEDDTGTLFASGGDDGDEIVVQVGDPPAESSLANLDIAGQGDDATIDGGQDEDVSVEVENTGGESGSFDVTLGIGADVEETQSTSTLATGETETVTFESVTGGLDSGDYDVTVSTDDDDISGTLTVEARPAFDSLTAEVTDYQSGQGVIREVKVDGDVNNLDTNGFIEINLNGNNIQGDESREIQMDNTFSETFTTGGGNSGPAEVEMTVRLLDENRGEYVRCESKGALSGSGDQLTLANDDFTCS